MAGRDAAPAVVPRTHGSGTPWVAVRPNYVGPPFSGLDAGRMNAGESLRDRGEPMAPRPAPEATAPGAQNRRDGAPRGVRVSPDAPAPRGVE